MKRISIYSFSFLIIVIPMLFVEASCESAVVTEYQTQRQTDDNTSGVTKASRPMIIWLQSLEGDLEVMRLAISGGVFSHVMLSWLHAYDRPFDLFNKNIQKAIRLCKERDVKVIWTRWLYPGYKFEKFKYEDAFTGEYYRQQIRQIKREAMLMGADFVALDAEPYANSPLKSLKLYPPRKLSETEFRKLNNAIEIAIKTEGQVDFVLPAASSLPRHLYNATCSLGKFVIAEHTYQDIPAKIEDKRRPYDIFGAYVKITKKNKKKPNQPYFTPREILQRQKLWSHKKGLFIYPGSRENAASVALEFSRIESVGPIHDGSNIP